MKCLNPNCDGRVHAKYRENANGMRLVTYICCRCNLEYTKREAT